MTTTYITDIHGEYEGFTHAMRTGSGVLYKLVDGVFGESLGEAARDELATFIAYPEKKKHLYLGGAEGKKKEAWLESKIQQIETLLVHVSADYGCEVFATEQTTRASMMEPLERVITLCSTIKKIMTGNLYILGDIYDRGPAPERVIDELKQLDNVHVLWGNHDMTWIGAAAAMPVCVATVVRICARYSNLDTLRGAYGINLDALINFANSAYKSDPCAGFALREEPACASRAEIEELMRVQKAIAIIQFKIEKRAIDENSSFSLSERALLHRINYDAHTITLDGQDYALKDAVFPTVDPRDPYKLTTEEQNIIDSLCKQFKQSARLQDHIQYLLRVGSLYAVHENNLLLHACVPLNEDGSLKTVKLYDKEYKGKALFDAMDAYVRDAFFATSEAGRERGRNIIWYLWLGAGSPLFAKSKMATFEMYFVEDKGTHKEVKNTFYSLERAEQLRPIFEDFGITGLTGASHAGQSAPERQPQQPAQSVTDTEQPATRQPALARQVPHIICGHVVVKYSRGETPVKCDGSLLMIDGGMSHAYQPTSGIGGFTLVSSEHALTLNVLEPLPATLDEIINNNSRTHAKSITLEVF